MQPTDQLRTILPMLTDIVGHIEPSQLDNPTPCARFATRDVVEHMISGATAFAPAFRGTASTPSSAADPDVGHPAPRFRAAMAELLDSVQSEGALVRDVDAPFGRVPGEVFARFVAFDGLIHGWDLATATGQPYSPPSDLVEAVDAFARQALTPAMRDGDTFATETQPPPDADTLTRLVAFSGRDVSATPRTASG